VSWAYHSNSGDITDAGTGVLAVTRSLGDASMKEFVVGSPYTTETALDDGDEFLIVACDGVSKSGTSFRTHADVSSCGTCARTKRPLISFGGSRTRRTRARSCSITP
jgi:serine/threonine protein phosphatase PrpC